MFHISELKMIFHFQMEKNLPFQVENFFRMTEKTSSEAFVSPFVIC